MNARRNRYIPGAMFGPFSFINVASEKEVLNAENGMKNMVEVAVVFRIMHLLYKECASSKHKVSIALLSPSPDQVKCMQQKLENYQQNNGFIKVRVGCVSDYQSGEADVVIISGAEEDEFYEVNTSLNNANVNLTWARHCLWILGDERMHLKEGSVWKSLILEAKASECFFQADENKDLAKVMFEVKKDLHQLDELLGGKSALFQNTTWKVLFSGIFRTSLSKIESSETKKLVFLMLLKLSSGWRPKRSSTAASVVESSYFELIKEFKVKGLHLICTIDIIKETHYTQVLKVWDILPFHEIAALVKRLEGVIGMYTREYIDHCKAKCVQRGSEYREYPMTWPGTPGIIQYKTHTNHCDEMFSSGAYGKGNVENVKVRESLILMKFYALSTRTANTIISGCDGGDLGIPFELTEQERNVISFDKSSFILGRSGTGKTTVLTMKLFQNEQLHHIASEGFHELMESEDEPMQDALHQLFVTFSSKLCYAVRQQFGEWKRLTCGGASASQRSLTYIDDIDEMMLAEDIPDQLTHLPQSVYPLIITFHRFLLMLDGTVGTSYFERRPNVKHLIYGNKTNTSRLNVFEKFMRLNEVTYERFCSAYWPHFNNKLTKNLDPSTVYTEIMSVIKGGLVSVNAPDGILHRDDYVALCDGRTSIFDEQKRESIYSIFLQYENKKVQKGNFDLADLVNDLHQRLEVEGYTGDIMDYVYVDEVQDLSMRQIMLFKYVCPNVQEGFAFSGDTAQAIAKGIDFRFEDIRCLFFEKFLLGSEKRKLSKIFQLTENFRTHAGVLNLAQSVINLLCHFFPLFVDALSPETSRIGGDLPILLETDINSNAIEFIFERIGDGQQITGFGAEQVVLVRDEFLKEKILDIVGKNALVLTIMESKGLEFQDVLLYDFFTTSSFSNEWRIIYEYMKNKDLLNSPSTMMPLCFDMQKHAVLCSELKQLYVAITRTRQRLWICESSGFSEPIYDYWKKLSLVEVKHLSDSFAHNMQIPSSKDEWRSRGFKLFHENNFRMAQMCFLKADDKYSENLAKAYHLRTIGGDGRASQFEREKLLKDAAELFSSIGKKELAAECFYEIGDYIAAGNIYKSESMIEKAGHCFHLAKCYDLAVEQYEKAGAYAKCLSACIDGKLFEFGFKLLGRCGECGDIELNFLHKGAHYYFSMEDFNSMMKFVRSFNENKKKRSFLTIRRCFDQLICLEKEWGKFEEAEKVMHKGAHYYFSIKDFKSMMKYVCSFSEKGKTRSFLRKRKCFDELISLEKEWGNLEEAAKVTQEAAYYYFSIKDFKNMMKYVCSFYEKGEMRSFLSKWRCFDELISLEKEWGNFNEAAKVTQEAAHYYFSIKDFKGMMKYVRSFSEKGKTRSFLTKRKCFDELISLEKEWGNFNEAAKVTQEAAHYYFSIKDFNSMMKFVRSFCDNDKMWSFFEEAAKVARLKPDPVLEAELFHLGAHHFFSIKDFESMMKCVRSFCDKDKMRNFLIENRCLDELIMLEKEWGNFKEAAKVARLKPDPVLEAELFHLGAHHFFSIKDFESMMKCVRSFCDKDNMRNFLIENRCLDELIMLEKEWGNFKEAAKVARMKPDPMLEADLLQMGGLNKEASLIILWHVFSNSLIFQNVEEPFTQDELLKKAISFGRLDSNAFYRFVCHEAEILSGGETEEEILEKGLKFIYCYKENALAASLEGVKTTREIKEIETKVIDLIRSFLKSTNRLKELLLLDEICGEFIEAAKIGNEDEHSIEAALSRLWYAFFGSLWTRGKRAWPLKNFKHKAELLHDANLYVTNHPNSPDSAIVDREIHILSGKEISLSQMLRYLKDTPRERSHRIHFLMSRRILDVHLRSHCKDYPSIETCIEDAAINHLEGRLMGNSVSVEGLIYFWNYWKELICELINWSPTHDQGCKASKIHDAFIFNYFGVRKYDGDKYGRYVVLNAEAQWVKETRPIMTRNGYLHIILGRQFSSAVSRYWCSELLSVAEKVFGKLESLHAYSTEKNLSMHQQTKNLTCLFEAVKSLKKCKFPNGRAHARVIVDKYSQLCVDQFLRNVSHINWKHAQSKEMICMRGNGTFLNMLKEAIDINSKSLKGRSCEWLGRIAVVFLGYKWIGFNADTERKLRFSSMNWRSLFRKLMNCDKLISKDGDLAIRLHNILKETFSAVRRGVDDCMSPACFLYLMDRLLILSFSVHGYVFTTRSSCVEWLSYGEHGMGLNGGCVISLDTMKNIYHSLASLVIEMLNSQDELMEWLRRSKESESSYPILILRSTVLLSLLCVNSGMHYDHLSHQLGRAFIISSLPSEFGVTLINGMKEHRLVEAVAAVCKMIDNPLVIMSAKEDFPKVTCQNAKFLNMEKPEFDHESLIEMLYSDPEAQESEFPHLSNWHH